MSTAAKNLYEVLRHVRPLHQYSAKAVGESLADRRVTVAMRAVLEQLLEFGPMTVPALARSQWLPRQAVQRVVNAAEDTGLVRRLPNPAHRRSRLVELTRAGEEAFEEIHAAELATLESIADGLPASEIEACVRVIRRLTAGVREQAARGEQDRYWSVPGPRPGEEVR